MTKYIIKGRYLPLYLMTLSCFIDSMNGMFYYKGLSLPISITFKILLLLTLSYNIRNIKHIHIYMIAVFFIFISYFFGIGYYGYGQIDISVRYLMLFASLLYFIELNRNLETERIVKLIINFSFIVISINVFLGYLGFGYTTYDSLPISSGLGFGFKGYFIAGNEVGALLLLILPLLIIVNDLSCKVIFRFFLYVIFFLLSVSLATKTIIIGTILSILFIESIVTRKKIFLIVTISLIFSSILYFYSNGVFDKFVERYTYILNEKGFINLIFSGRLDFLSEIWGFHISQNGFLHILFGTPIQYLSLYMKPFVEIDFFDILITNGLFVLIIIICACFYIFTRVLTTKQVNNKSKYILLTPMFILFLVSFFAGHILNSGMLLPILPIVIYFTKELDINEYYMDR